MTDIASGFPDSSSPFPLPPDFFFPAAADDDECDCNAVVGRLLAADDDVDE